MMNIATWVLAGGAFGWIGYTYLNLNQDRSMMVSVMIGMAGGFAGGKLLAPMFVAASTVPGGFSAPTLFFAAALAAGFLFAGDQIHKRWGV